MGRVVSFDTMALARLRDRLGAAETARADLVAFARGHSAAVASIHKAVLAALEANDLDALLAIVASEWPWILGVDWVALALVAGERSVLAVDGEVRDLARPIAERASKYADTPVLRRVERGLPLFGAGAEAVRVEALVPVGSHSGPVQGLLLLGQSEPVDCDGGHGLELLRFLGDSLAAIVARWTCPTLPPTPTRRAP